MKLGGKEREMTYHCAVSPDLNDRLARSILSTLGNFALAGFLDAATLEEEAVGPMSGTVALPDIFGNKTNYK